MSDVSITDLIAESHAYLAEKNSVGPSIVSEIRGSLISRLTVALEYVTDDRDRFVRLWSLAADSVVRLQAELEDEPDERDDPNNWPDGAPWLKEAATVPTENEQKRVAVGDVFNLRVEVVGTNHEFNWANVELESGAVVAASISGDLHHLPVQLEPEWEYRRVPENGQLAICHTFESMPELDEGWIAERRSVGKWLPVEPVQVEQEQDIRGRIADLLIRRADKEAPNAAESLRFMAGVVRSGDDLPESMLGAVPVEPGAAGMENARILGRWLFENYPSSEPDIAVVALAVLKSLSAVPVERNEFNAQVLAERQRQIAKGYDQAHDDKHGVDHLIMWAQDYARRGESVQSAALMEAARECLLRKRLAVPVEPEWGLSDCLLDTFPQPHFTSTEENVKTQQRMGHPAIKVVSRVVSRWRFVPREKVDPQPQDLETEGETK